MYTTLIGVAFGYAVGYLTCFFYSLIISDHNKAEFLDKVEMWDCHSKISETIRLYFNKDKINVYSKSLLPCEQRF